MPAFSYTSGDPTNLVANANASMADVQGPLVDIRTFLNGGLGNSNLAANAGVLETQLASGSSGPAKGAFSAYLNQAQTLGAVTAAKVTLNAEEFDVSGWFDSTTNFRYTPQVPGYYRFSAAVSFNAGPVAGTYALIDLYKNGAQFKRLAQVYHGTAGAGVLPSGSALVAMNGSTDYVELFAANAVGTGLAALAAQTYFQGELVGRS